MKKVTEINLRVGDAIRKGLQRKGMNSKRSLLHWLVPRSARFLHISMGMHSPRLIFCL